MLAKQVLIHIKEQLVLPVHIALVQCILCEVSFILYSVSWSRVKNAKSSLIPVQQFIMCIRMYIRH